MWFKITLPLKGFENKIKEGQINDSYLQPRLSFVRKISKDIAITLIKRLFDVKSTVKNYDIIVNATSVGLRNEPSIISLEGINEKTIVYDIVYMPMNTDFIKKAKEKNAIVIYGYEMLLGQAVRAFEIWHGMEAPYNAMKKALLGGF